MKSPEYILDYITGVIEGLEENNDPYSHFYTTGIFPDEFYDDILKHLPPLKHYENFSHPDAILPSGKSARNRLPLGPKSIAKLPEKYRNFWEQYAPIFESDQFKFSVYNILQHDLKKRFEDLKSIPAKPHVFLFRDTTGYTIRPHPDTAGKAATVLFYLPRDNSVPEYGTWMYKKNGDDKFDKVQQWKFLKNSVGGFPVSDKSYHGVEQIRDSNTTRDVLMVIYYIKKKFKDEY